MLRTVNDQPTLWETILPAGFLGLPAELARWTRCWTTRCSSSRSGRTSARLGRPSIPMETYLRMMFLKHRYRLGYETLCREVADSISWPRFCRIPLGDAGAAPDHAGEDHHPLRARGDRRR